MEQNALDLLGLFTGFLVVMSLPVWVGIVAILRDKAD